jgi:hypothetical protein
LFIKSANSIYDDVFRDFLVESGEVQRLMSNFENIDQQDQFLTFYPEWIQSSRLNRISGLETYPYRFVSLGCTQALDEFHYWCALHKRRIRVFKGEYPYTRDCIAFNWDRDFIEQESLKTGEAVIVSAPFSGSGQVHERWGWLLETCQKLDIPILVDMAFFGTCWGINLDLSHPAIQAVVFSTTKGLACGNYRSGIVFSRRESGHLAVQTQWHHGIHLNVSLGLALMREFSPDYLVDKYRNAYREVCEAFDLMPTSCVHLALGGDKWHEYHRDGVFNRVGVRNMVKKAHQLQRSGLQGVDLRSKLLSFS